MSQFTSISKLAQQLYRSREREYRSPAQRLDSPRVTMVPSPIEEWSQSKQLALLTIARVGGARDCVEHMRDAGIKASQEDFLALRNEGLAVRPLGERYHRLTPAGLRYAGQLQKAVAQRLGLHHIEYMDTSYCASAKCTCGYFKSFERKYGGERSQLERAISRHLVDPQAYLREREAASIAMDKAIAKIVRGANG